MVKVITKISFRLIKEHQVKISQYNRKNIKKYFLYFSLKLMSLAIYTIKYPLINVKNTFKSTGG